MEHKLKNLVAVSVLKDIQDLHVKLTLMNVILILVTMEEHALMA